MSSASPHEDAWRRLAEANLGGGTLDGLVFATPEGIAIEPLYTERHLLGLTPRGESAEGTFARRHEPGAPTWAVAERLEVSASRAPERLESATRSGADAVWLDGDDGVALAAWEAVGRTAARNLHLLLEAGGAALAVHGTLVRAGAARVSALHDPLGAALGGEGAVEVDFAAAAELCRAPASGAGPVFPLAVRPSLVHEAGGHAALEIGFTLAALAELVRRLAPLGVTPDRALASTALVVTAGVDQFAAIAKLRAIRLAYAKLARALGVQAAPPPYVIGHVSRRAQSRADAATNHVRATIEAFSLAVGGADVVVGRPFDDVAREPSALGERIARNTPLVLREESHLGEVGDAARGSYFVEALTEALARAGWEELRAIEREGGVVASLAAGAFSGRVQRAAESLLADARRRKRVIVGTSEHAVAGERLAPSSPQRGDGAFRAIRAAEPFEKVRERTQALADAGARPVAVTVRLGAATEWRAREEFARRLFEVGGFEVRAMALEEAVAHAGGREGGRAAFVLCSSDARYGELAVPSARDLAQAGARVVLLAGRPGPLEAALREAGVLGEIFLGCDVPRVLETVLEALRSKEVVS